jgi:hypothetical protein
VTQITMANGRLRVEILGWDKLWAFKSRLDFPREHVVQARRWDPERDPKWKGFRSPGTCLPGVIVAGTYRRKGERIFYDVHKFRHAIVVELRDEPFARIVVEVKDPDAVLRLISQP